MQSDLFFSQTQPQAVSSGVGGEKAIGAKLASFSKHDAVNRGDTNQGESFVSTLRGISGHKREAAQGLESQPKSQTRKADSQLGFAGTSKDDVDSPNEPLNSSSQPDGDNETSDISSAGLSQWIDLLSALGYDMSGSDGHFSLGGHAAEDSRQNITNKGFLMGGLDQLLALVPRTSERSLSDTTIDFSHLKQLVTKILNHMGQPIDKVFIGQSSPHACYEQLLELLQLEANLKKEYSSVPNNASVLPEKGTAIGALAKLMANALGLNADTAQSAQQTAESGSWKQLTETRTDDLSHHTAQLTKAATESRVGMLEADSGLMGAKNATAGQSYEKPAPFLEIAADGGKSSEAIRVKTAVETDPQSVASESIRVMTSADQKWMPSDPIPKEQNQSKGVSFLNLNAESAMAGDNASANLAGDERLTKLIGIAQSGKGTETKTETTLGNHLQQKIFGIDSDIKDNGWLSSQGQSTEKVADNTATVRESGVHTNLLRSEPLEQIVQKAVFHLKNGQNEVQIDLKPDFLGHVRLQIATENHQVTVRIFAESPVVKELIENHLPQLKADLQQQGLEIDELEVSVDHGADAYGFSQDNRGEAKPLKGGFSDGSTPDASVEENTHAVHTAARSNGIDYFA